MSGVPVASNSWALFPVSGVKAVLRTCQSVSGALISLSAGPTDGDPGRLSMSERLRASPSSSGDRPVTLPAKEVSPR